MQNCHSTTSTIYSSAAKTSLDSTNGWSARRSPVFSQYGCVSSSQPLATAAGIEILRRGGNAADAAVAVASTLAVTEPCSTGLGGDYFLLYYDAKTTKVTAINGSGRSSANLTYERAVTEAGSSPDNCLTPTSAHCVTVPGAVRGWEDTVKRHGRLTLAENLSQAADIAAKGWPVAPVTAHAWNKLKPQLARWQHVSEAVSPSELLVQDKTAPQGLRAPLAGEIFKRPNVARVLNEIGKGGADVFYNQGWISEALIAAVTACGGCLDETDLQQHASSTFPDPIAVAYRGVDIYEHPPNGQGLCALIALNILNHVPQEMLGTEADPAQRAHVQIEALRLAFADARQFIADPTYSTANGKHNDTTCPPELVQALLSPSYGKKRAGMIDLSSLGRANPNVEHGVPLASCDTVSFQVVDIHGNAASVVNSNYEGFGSGIVPTGLGFSLQNRGANFKMDLKHPNCVAPGKRPYHTIIPGMAIKDNQLFATFTNMGGFMQPQGHVQLLSNILDLGMDPQAAIDQPRFCISQVGDGLVHFEDGTPTGVLNNLYTRGHNMTRETTESTTVPVVVCGSDRSMFGRAQIILYNPMDGVCCAGSDGRGDGCAAPLLSPPVTTNNDKDNNDNDDNNNSATTMTPVSTTTATALPVPPPSPSSLPTQTLPQTLNGELFVYRTSPSTQVAMCCTPPSSSSPRGVIVFIPGLTDGLLGCQYVESLSQMAMKEQYMFVQPTLSSSWTGYGTSNLTQDVLELDDLLSSTARMRQMTELRTVVLIGHSTGCQDIVHYMKHGKYKHHICSIVLQAPVSDREASLLEAQENRSEKALMASIDIATQAVRGGNGSTVLMARNTPGTYGVPMTAERYHSLNTRMSPEDVFSSDLTEEELQIQLGHIQLLPNVYTCCVLSGNDEYVSQTLLKDYASFGQALLRAMGGGGTSHVIENGGHGLRESICYNQFVNIVRSIVQKIESR